MSNPTFNQAAHALKVLNDQDLSLENYQILIDGGYLTDLARAAKKGKLAIDTVRRDEVRKALGISQLGQYAVQDFDQGYPQMVREAKFSFIAPSFMGGRFTVTGTGRVRYSFKIFGPGAIYTDRVLAKVKAEGFLPADLGAGLAFARDYPNAQVKEHIALLGSSVEEDGKAYYPVLSGASDRTRDLRMVAEPEEAWSDKWSFLGAKQIPLQSS